MTLQNKTFFTSILDIKYSMYSIVISYPTWKLVSSKYILQSRAFSSQHIIDNKFVHHPKYSYINKKWERGKNTKYILQKSLFSIPQFPSPPIQDNKYNVWVIIISQTKTFSTSHYVKNWFKKGADSRHSISRNKSWFILNLFCP